MNKLNEPTVKMQVRLMEVAFELGAVVRFQKYFTMMSKYYRWDNGITGSRDITFPITSAEDAMEFEALCRKEFSR